MPLGTDIGLGPSHIVLDGDPAPPSIEKGTAAPQFSAHVYCGHGRPSQLLMSSCLSCVCWATACKTVRPMLSDRCPVLSVCLSVCNVSVLWPNGWMDQDEAPATLC